MDERRLNEKIGNKDRLKRFDSVEWFLSCDSLSNFGAWPEMKGIDLRFTAGSIRDTARKIKACMEGSLDFDIIQDREEKLDVLMIKLDSIRANLSCVLNNYSVIVVRAI